MEKSDLIEKSFECLKNIEFNDATKETARDVILNEYYLTLKDNYELKEQIKNQSEIIRKQNEKIIPENIDLHNRINKAIEYINYMFDKANENDIIDDLLKIEKILKESEE